ncbi:MAG: polyphosphate kinase 1 [Bacteroidia bacterium]|nr:polyphosphate kinase 1 [Bacteroidia bacterium]
MAQTQSTVNLQDPKYYINRELSWLRFNERVLEEAQDKRHPILERWKFATIFTTNLDEFFMIRVAGFKEQIDAEIVTHTPDGLTPREQLEKIYRLLHPMIASHSKTILEEIVPELRKKGVRFRNYQTLTDNQQEYVHKFFRNQVFPILTPLAIDPTHPFPKFRNLGLNLLVELREPFRKTGHKIAVVPLPGILPRYLYFNHHRKYDLILLEQIVEEHIDMLFPNMKIINISQFRITRNTDLDISEAEADDLLKMIEKEIRNQKHGEVIRLEVSDSMSESSRKTLVDIMKLHPNDLYVVKGMLGLDALKSLSDVIENPDIKDSPFVAAIPPALLNKSNIFEAIRKRDILLHHPYDSFYPIIELIKEAAKDPAVLAIKQTLYRTSGKSPIVAALKEAVANGKQVTALIELKARFNEETNIVWARELETAGATVIYGVMGLKTHCKVLQIVRKEKDDVVLYSHLSTGNYNETTAKIYTDLGLLTANRAIGEDLSELFNVLTGYSRQTGWRKIYIAPINMRQRCLELIEECIKYHTAEVPSRIRIVMNSLLDTEMIYQLYRASVAGVKIDLVIRGICSLIPGIKQVSENITVRSIVGRFLEHSRIYYFEYNGIVNLYSGSADWMPRNLNKRVEVMFPLDDDLVKQQTMDILDTMFKDNEKARILSPDGTYRKVDKLNTDSKELFSAQDYFLTFSQQRQRAVENVPFNQLQP